MIAGYETVCLAQKYALVREICRYHLPYVKREISLAQYESDWATYMRPLLFDLLFTNFYDLGMRPFSGDVSSCYIDRESNHRCRWSDVPIYDWNPVQVTPFLHLPDLTIPYSGPYQPVLESDSEVLNTNPWIEEDDVGPWTDPWTDESGVYYPGYYEGNFDVETNHMDAHINNFDGCSRVYYDGGPGHFQDFVHEFEFSHPGPNQAPGSFLIYAVRNDIRNRNIPGITGRQYRLGIRMSRASTGESLNVESLAQPSMEYLVGSSVKLYDALNNNTIVPYDLSTMYRAGTIVGGSIFEEEKLPRDFKITVEKRGNQAVAIIWQRRYYIQPYSPIPEEWRRSFCSFRYPFMNYGPGVCYDLWPGIPNPSSSNASDRPDDCVYWVRKRIAGCTPEWACYHYYGFVLHAPPDYPELRDTEFWWPVDVVRMYCNTADTDYPFDYRYLQIGHNERCGGSGTDYVLPKIYKIENLNLYDSKPTDYGSLFIDGGAYDNNYVSLFNISGLPADSGLPLYTEAIDVASSGVPLYTKWDWDSFDDNTSLFTFGLEASGIYSTTPLYMNPPLPESSGLPLFLYNDQGSGNSVIPLHMIGVPYPVSGDISTFIYDGTGLQDFTDYTLVDPSGYYDDMWTYNRIHGELITDENSRFYYDFGDGFFCEEYDFDFEFEYRHIGSGDAHLIAMSNTLSSPSGWLPYNEEAIGVKLRNDGALVLYNYESGSGQVFTDLEMGRHYWCTLARNNTETGYEVKLTAYLDAGKNYEKFSLPVSVDASRTHRYLLVGDGFDLDTNDTIEFIVENIRFDLFSSQDFLKLISYGVELADVSCTFYMIGWAETSNVYTTLHTFGGTEGWSYNYDNIPLYINDSGYIGEEGEYSITLFLFNDDPFVSLAETATLYIDGEYWTLENNITLVTFMLTTEDSMSMYIETPGDREDWYPDFDELPVYINRPDESDVITMFLKNQWIESNTYTSLHTFGILGREDSNVTLAMSDVIWGRPNTYTSLYMEGVVPVTDSMGMVMSDTLARSGEGLDLICYHGGAEPNVYCSMYIFGAYLENDNITLAMPDVLGQQTDDVNLFTRGY